MSGPPPTTILIVRCGGPGRDGKEGGCGNRLAWVHIQNGEPILAGHFGQKMDALGNTTSYAPFLYNGRDPARDRVRQRTEEPHEAPLKEITSDPVTRPCSRCRTSVRYSVVEIREAVSRREKRVIARPV